MSSPSFGKSYLHIKNITKIKEFQVLLQIIRHINYGIAGGFCPLCTENFSLLEEITTLSPAFSSFVIICVLVSSIEFSFAFAPKAASHGVIGKVVLKIPGLGNVQRFVGSKIGWLVVVIIPALVIIIQDIMKLIKVSNVKKRAEIENQKIVSQEEHLQ